MAHDLDCPRKGVTGKRATIKCTCGETVRAQRASFYALERKRLERNIPELPEFSPCAIFYPDGGHTELVLRDVPTVWAEGIAFDLGYDFDGRLVAVRIPGDVTER